MTTKIVKGTFLARRDNEYNYNKKSDYIPSKGEILLVDTAKKGLLTKMGDGATSYDNLPFSNEIFAEVNFFEKNAYSAGKLVTPTFNKIYIDIENPNSLYYYDGFGYQLIGALPPSLASSDTPGVMKLYSSQGSNEDGTMTQKAITDSLGLKLEATVNESEETIIFN